MNDFVRDRPFTPELLHIAGRKDLGHDFYIGRYSVTFGEFDYFCHQTGRPLKPDNGWGRGINPAIHVSWCDAQAYVNWLTLQTGRTYRLPRRAEWVFAARAGTTSAYWWGDDIDEGDANFISTPGYSTFSVNSLRPNPWGLYNVLGNVDEWIDEAVGPDMRLVAGGNWSSTAQELRPESVRMLVANTSNDKTGLRVVGQI